MKLNYGTCYQCNGPITDPRGYNDIVNTHHRVHRTCLESYRKVRAARINKLNK